MNKQVEGQLTLFPEGSPVNLSPLPGSGEDDRFLWPEMVRVIEELRPAWVIGENVAGIVTMELDAVLSDLESKGYATRTFLVPAAGVGAPHMRYRTAIVGYTEHNGPSAAEIAEGNKTAGGRKQEGKDTAGKSEGAGKHGNSKDVAYSKRNGKRGLPVGEEKEKSGFGSCCKNVAYSDGIGYTEPATGESGNDKKWDNQAQEQGGWTEHYEAFAGSEDVQYANGAGCKELHIPTKPNEPGFAGRGCDAGNVPDTNDTAATRYGKNGGKVHEEPEAAGFNFRSGKEWWAAEPGVGRVADGIPNRVDRIKCLGNAVVPQQFYPFFKTIYEIETKQILL